MFGQNADEDEEFNKMITQLAGAPRSGPMGSPEDFFAEQAQPQAATPSRQSIYTPPPQVEPQYQQKVGGREFGVGDIAMLGGIVASLLAKKPGVTAALAGQYGGAVMQDQGRRDAQNQEIERYNNKLANENDPMDRWQRDTAAKIQVGNLEARDAATALERAREERMAQRLADEADPESPINQAKLTRAQKLSEIEIAQRKAVGEMSLQEKLAVLAAEQKGRAVKGGYRGGGGGGTSNVGAFSGGTGGGGGLTSVGLTLPAIFTVSGSTTSTPDRPPGPAFSNPAMAPKKPAPGDWVSGLVTRSSEYFTSSAVISRPLWNFTPARRWKV